MNALTIPMDAIVQALVSRPEVTDAVSANIGELLTLSHGEAAKAIGVGREFFRGITDSPGGPQSIMIGKMRRWRLKDLTAWMDGLDSSRAKQIGLSPRVYNRIKAASESPPQPPSGYQTFGRKPKAS